MARYAKQKTPQAVRNPFEPMLKTVEQMAVVSGIGENRLRQLMDNGELEFIQNGDPGKVCKQRVLIWRSAREKSKTSETAKEF